MARSTWGRQDWRGPERAGHDGAALDLGALHRPLGHDLYQGTCSGEWQGDLLVGALRGQALLRLHLDGDKIVSAERLLTDLGSGSVPSRRGPDGALYLLTDSGQGACSN